MRTIRHVDAFTATPLEGNPAAVVDGDGLDGETMQRIALNQKLSETVFLLPPETPEGHARLRIFTPGAEVPFAGHPVVAAAHTIITEQIATPAVDEDLRLETGAGLIPLSIGDEDPPFYTMRQAAPAFRDAKAPHDALARCVGLRAGDIVRTGFVSTGLEWLLVQIERERMPAVKPDLAALMEYPLAVFCVLPPGEDAGVHLRVFAPSFGVVEDPVTGSANGCIAAFIAKHALMPARDGVISYEARQGIEMGQPGLARVRVEGVDGDLAVYVGGQAVTVVRGELLV